MEFMGEKLYFTPGEFEGSDSAAIQAAVNEAERTEVRTVLIPAKADGTPWVLTETILVPTNMTIILNACTVEAACTAFANSNAGVPGTRTLAGEQSKIFLLGRHGAVIRATADAPQIKLVNVRDSRVANLTFEGGAGLVFDFFQLSKVQYLKFFGSKNAVTFMEGCNNIILESIQAETVNEAVLVRGGEGTLFGRSAELYNSILCRIQAKTQGAPAVALYAGKTPMYNIVVRDVTDDTVGGGASVRIGDRSDEAGIRDLTVRGVKSNRVCVETGTCCDGMFYSNLHGTNALSRVVANTRELLDQETMEIVLPQFPVDVDRPFLSANDPEFFADGDAQTIQNAVDAADLRGINCVVIPRWNVRTQSAAWHIEKAIKLPSYMTVILLNCYMRQVDFVYENIFTNAHAHVYVGRSLSCEEHDLTITGIGNAVLDGGLPNGLLEKTCFLNGFPDKRYNATVLFNNVHNLVLEDFQICQARWYCTYFIYCDTVRLSNLDFENWENCCNRDLVDIRGGCHNFTIENITGTAGDDVIAMNNLGNDGNDGRHVAGKDRDTLRMSVRNVKADARRWFTVRLLDQDRHLEQYITLDTIIDSSESTDKKRCQATIMIGSHEYHYKIPAELGDLAHLTIRDIYSRSTRAVAFGGFSEDVKVSNLHAYDDCPFAVGVNVKAGTKDVHINGVFYKRNHRHLTLVGTADSGTQVEQDASRDKPRLYGTNHLELTSGVSGVVLELNNMKAENFLVENVFADWATTGVEQSGSTGTMEVRNFNLDNLSGSLVSRDEKATLILNGEVFASAK